MGGSSSAEERTPDDGSEATGFAFASPRDRVYDLCLFSLGDQDRSAAVTAAVLADETDAQADADLYRRIADAVTRVAAAEPPTVTDWPLVGKYDVDRGRAFVAGLVAQWPATDRLVFAMRTRHGCDPVTTASALGMTLETVGPTVERLREQLETHLDRALTDEVIRVALPPLRMEPVESPQPPHAVALSSIIAIVLLLVGVGLVLFGLASLALD